MLLPLSFHLQIIITELILQEFSIAESVLNPLKDIVLLARACIMLM